MSKSMRARVALVAVTAAVFVVLAADRPALAGDPKTGRIDIEARLEPADLQPGAKGKLIIEARLLPKLHIYATGEQKMTYGALEAKGVTYDLASARLTEHHEWKDEFGDAYDVWEGTFTYEVGVTLAEDVAAGTRVGMWFTYYGCNDRGCYPPVRKHEAAVTIGGDSAGAAPGVIADGPPKVSLANEYDEGTVTLAISEERKLVAVTFQPGFGFWFYPPGSTEGAPVSVTPKVAEGVKWGKPQHPPAMGEKIETDYTVTIPYEREPGVKELLVETSFAGCDDAGCRQPRTETLSVAWPGAPKAANGAARPRGDGAPAAPKGSLLFEVVGEDDIDADGNILGLLGLFVFGMGLAFTPCVLPIIPITVSVITGGKADIPRKRLAGLLLTYVGGLGLTFATMGVIAALAGGNMAAAFNLPAVQWGIAILFVILGFMMLGLYELQPPAWLMKLQGGAQKRSGSYIGAFLFGCLGAVIASPCTGPLIAGLLIEVAKSGDALMGFIWFLSLGLGMGAVFFAAGSFNFLLRPGPWMVWVRYTFAALLLGAALYYLGAGRLISFELLLIAGFGLALLSGFAVAWHLHKKEAEEIGAARIRGAKVAVMLVCVVGFVGFITKPPPKGSQLEWVYVKNPQHLKQLVAEANAGGKPAVVDFWATWCHYCKEYDKLIADTPELREQFQQVARLKVDVTGGNRWPLRHAVGLKAPSQPYMVVIDKQGRIRRNADVKEWYGYDDGPDELRKRLDLVLGEEGSVKTSSR